MNNPPSVPSGGSPAIVIGAGFAGLATAILLADEGYRVTVVEKNATVGGRAGLLEDPQAPGFRWDTGPSWYLMPEAYDNFFALAGTSTEEQLELVDLDPGYRVFPEGADPLDVSANPAELAALFESIEPGAGEKLTEYLRKAEEIYALSVQSFLYTTYNDVSPFFGLGSVGAGIDLLRNLVTSLSRHVAEQFVDVRLQQILAYPAVFLSARPEDTPALYQLMSYTDLVQGVKYPLGGFTAIVDSLYRMAQQRGVEFKFNTACERITTNKAGKLGIPGTAGFRAVASGVMVTVDGRHEHIPADVVVSCADLHFTETSLLPRALQSYPERAWTRRNPGIGSVLVMLGVEGELPQLSHHNLMFSHDWTPDFDAVFEGDGGERSASIYISKPSASDSSVAPAGHENLFVLVPVAADPEIGRGSAYCDQPSERVEAIADATIEQIAQWAGIDDLAERIVARHTLGPGDFQERYHSWQGGALGPAHTLRQSAFLRGKNRSAKVENLFYAGGTTVPGVGVPMCLISAENVIKRLRGDGSAGALGAL